MQDDYLSRDLEVNDLTFEGGFAFEGLRLAREKVVMD